MSETIPNLPLSELAAFLDCPEEQAVAIALHIVKEPDGIREELAKVLNPEAEIDKLLRCSVPNDPTALGQIMFSNLGSRFMFTALVGMLDYVGAPNCITFAFDRQIFDMGEPPVEDAEVLLKCPTKLVRFTIERGEGKSALDLRSEALAALEEMREQKRVAYRERNRVVIALAHMALQLGFRAGVAEHEPKEGETWDPTWNMAIRIDLPDGQVSWHVPDDQKHLLCNLPAYKGEYDGHDSVEKYARLAAFTEAPSNG